MKRYGLIAAGWIAVLVALIGVVVPLLPTTPFVLLAAACFAQSSPRFHQWLLANRVLGPVLSNWQETRSIPRRSKYLAVATIIVSGAIALTLLVMPLLKLLLVVALLIPIVIVLRTPCSEDLVPVEANSVKAKQ